MKIHIPIQTATEARTHTQKHTDTKTNTNLATQQFILASDLYTVFPTVDLCLDPFVFLINF